MLEVELKSVVDELPRRRAAVEAAGGVLVFSGRLEDRRYDTPARSLAAQDHVLRMRVYRTGEGTKAELDWKQLRDRNEEPARKIVHARLVLDAIALAEAVKVDRKDVEERIRREAERIGESYEEVRLRLSKGGGLQALETQMVREKSLDLITSIANIQGAE